MAELHLVEHGNGDYSIGAEIEDTFIPFVTIAASRIKHYQERAATLAERADSGDPEEDARLQAAHDALPTSVPKAEPEPEPEAAPSAPAEPAPSSPAEPAPTYEQGGGEIA